MTIVDFTSTMHGMKGTKLFASTSLMFLLCFESVHAADSLLYRVPTDVMDSGGGEGAQSANYILNDSIGEPIVGHARTSNYFLESGYRKPSAAEFLSVACGTSVSLGSMLPGQQKTGSVSCTVYSDAVNGYSMSWSVPTGSGGVNTGSLISEYNTTIPPYSPAIANTPETWSVASNTAEWGGRLQSSSTDTSVEWGTDSSSEKWLNVEKITPRTIVARSSATPLSGSVQNIQFRTEQGSSSVLVNGTYRATVVITVIGY